MVGALRQILVAIACAIDRHRQLGEAIAVWKDGQVVVLTADQIPELVSRLDEGIPSNGVGESS